MSSRRHPLPVEPEPYVASKLKRKILCEAVVWEVGCRLDTGWQIETFASTRSCPGRALVSARSTQRGQGRSIVGDFPPVRRRCTS